MGRDATNADVLILGQGLAGSTLAWRLAERGVSVVVVDRGGVDELGKPTASHVAAGLITPVTGKRLTVAEDYQALRVSAEEFYRRVERRCDESVLQVAPALRVFVDGEERRTFLDRLERGRLGAHARLAEDNEALHGLPAPHGAFVMPNAARLRIAVYLAATRRWLESEGRFMLSAVDPERDMEITVSGVLAPELGLTTKRLVLCQGFAPRQPRWLRGVRFRPAKGEVLTIESPACRETRVVHRGGWLAPEPTLGRFRFGSTTDWERLNSMPTEAGRAELLQQLTESGVRDARVVEHLAAVRPATYDRRPAYGFCPDEPVVGWFNGLGAKGSLWAPFYAERMADLVVQSLG